MMAAVHVVCAGIMKFSVTLSCLLYSACLASLLYTLETTNVKLLCPLTFLELLLLLTLLTFLVAFFLEKAGDAETAERQRRCCLHF